MSVYATKLNAAVASFHANDWDRTLKLCNDLLKSAPNDSDALHIYAIALTNKGSHDLAEQAARKALRGANNNSSCHNTLGNILRAKHHYAEALKEFEIALKLDPGVPDYHNNIGLTLCDLVEFTKAIPFLENAIRLHPGFSKAYMNLGVCYEGLERYEEAFKCLGKAANLAPNDDTICSELVSYVMRCRRLDLAIAIATDFIIRVPFSHEMYMLLAESYDLDGNYESALATYDEALKKLPNSVFLKMRRALLLPTIMSSNEEIDRIRQQFLANIDTLMQEKPQIEQLEKGNFRVPFYSTYYGRNDTSVRIKLAELFRTLYPSLQYTAPHCMNYKAQAGRKIRIALVDNFLFNGSGAALYDKLMEMLAQNPAFDLYILRFTDTKQDVLQRYVKPGQLKILPKDLASAREIISTLQLDVMLYTELSLSLVTYLLAFARLAPIQAVFAWGHPITSGIPTIDYSLSTSLMEPENGQEHYSEKLVQCSTWPFVFHKPKVPTGEKSRAELHLPEGTLYACPLLPFRIHPDMDPIFVEILEKDATAKIILFGSDGGESQWVPLLKARLSKTIPAVLQKRIIVLPFARGDDFILTLKKVDCIIDAFHFSMGLTAFPLFAAGLPVVAWPGPFMRGRAVYSMYKKMEMMDLVATDKTHYVELALKVAHDPTLRKQLGETIQNRMNRIFEDDSGIKEVTTFFSEAYAKYIPGASA